MFPSRTLIFLSVITATYAAPFSKRIAQTIADSTAKWEQACLAAGGADKCNPQSIASFTTLLAAAGPCDQQNAGDSMIDLAKQLNSDPDMIEFTQIFVQQPRNSPDALSVPYCQQAPKNPELNGLFQCQFQGSNPTLFVGNAQVGTTGTIPLGQSQVLNPAGSCPANPSGPIADGTQLTDITLDPGVSATASAISPPAVVSSITIVSGDVPSTVSASVAEASATPLPNGSDSGVGDDAGGNDSGSGEGSTGDDTGNDSGSDSGSPGADGGADTSATPASFKLQNGEDAQKENAQFGTLTASSSCTAGESACVNGSFAQCVGTAFALTPCAGGTQCFALPLVNKPGTSVACTTQADALARIAATGATGGVTGD